MTQRENIGRYPVLEDIASGSQGAVYQAYDTENSQIVALKVLHPHLRDPEYLERFAREASLTISIDHPNVITVFEVGHDGTQHFMSMEYLPQSLSRILSTGSEMDLTQVVQFGVQICDGLSAAHDLGIVHRDLKPQNVLIGTNGEAKVTDFGIARAAQMNTMTATGTLMGTPLYMSPEASEGENVDFRADIYSVGCMLYEMISGRVPSMVILQWQL